MGRSVWGGVYGEESMGRKYINILEWDADF